MNPEELQALRDFVDRALAEDRGDGDHTSLATIPADRTGRGEVLIKESGVLAGMDEAREVLKRVDDTLNVSVIFKDGDQVQKGDVVMTIQGTIRSILLAERLLLNIMQRMCGIATLTNRIAARIADTNTRILDTRKTTPLLRFLEKKAVRIGGGVNHRFGLYDMILIKDNHVDGAGGIAQAIEAANKYRATLGKKIDVEIEVRNDRELDEVLQIGGVDRIMLDNFTPEEVALAVKKIAGRYVTEASGGITEHSIRDFALAGVDFVSMGALTHSVKSLDISLKIRAVD